MSTKKSIVMILVLTLSIFLFFNCAGTKGDEPPDFYGDDNSQQDDLDDIEALLGITDSEETTQPAEQPKTRGEELNLLKGNEVLAQEPAVQQSNTQEDAKDGKVAQLEDELQKKNREITNLESDLQSKDALIDDLNSRPVSTPVKNNTRAIETTATSDYEMRYQMGRDAFESRNYEAAIQYFESLLATSTTNSLADNAQYWIGESHYALKQYDSAIIDFEKVLTFPKSNKNVDSQYMIGSCYLRKGNIAKAVEEFERLNADYPGNRFEQKVNKILAEL